MGSIHASAQFCFDKVFFMGKYSAEEKKKEECTSYHRKMFGKIIIK